jgi:hypothetical protein
MNCRRRYCAARERCDGRACVSVATRASGAIGTVHRSRSQTVSDNIRGKAQIQLVVKYVFRVSFNDN